MSYTPEQIVALEQELAHLKQDKALMEEKRFLDTALASFSDLMRLRVDQSIEQWADNLLAALVSTVGGLQAALFAVNEADPEALRCVGGYARPEGSPDELRLGVGIAGQAAKTGELVVFQENASFRALTHSSLAVVEAQALVVLPLRYNDALEGLLEMTAVRPFRNSEVELLRTLAHSLAANLNTIRSQDKIQQLYHDAQEKSIALATQEEELRQNLEELQATQEQMRLAQETALQQSTLLQGLMDASSEVIMAADRQLRLTHFNTQAAAVFERGDVRLRVGMQLQEAVGSDDVGGFFQSLWERCLRGETVTEEVKSKIGGVNAVYASTFNPIRGKDGSVIGAVNFSRDITERKHLEEQLRIQNEELVAREEELRQNLEELQATQEQMRAARDEAEKQGNWIRTLLDRNVDSITAIGADKRVIIFNKAAEERFLSSYNVQLYPGIHASEMMAPERFKLFEPMLERVLTGEEVRFESELKDVRDPETGDLTSRFFDITYLPIYQGGTTPTAALTVSRDITNRKRMEAKVQVQNEELQAREEELRQNLEELQATQEQMREAKDEAERQGKWMRTLLDKNEDSITAIGADFRLLVYNRAAQERFLNLFGVVLAPGMPASEMMPPDRYAAFEPLLKRVLDGENVRFESSQKDVPDPETGELTDRFFDVSYSPIRVSRREISAIFTVSRDVTHRRRLEAELEKQNQELAQREEEMRQNLEHMQAMQHELDSGRRRMLRLTNSLPGMVYEYSLNPETQEQGFQYVSDKSMVVLGMMPEQVLNGELTERIHPDDLQPFVEAVASSAQNLTPYVQQLRMRNRLGDFEWLEAQSLPTKHSDGRIVWYGYLQNITDRKQQEEDLAQRAQLQRSLIETRDDLVAVVDAKLQLLLFNDRLNTFNSNSSTSKPASMGAPYLQLVAPEAQPEVKQLLERCLAGEHFTHELRFKGAQGWQYYLQEYIPLTDPDGTTRRVAVVSKDFTARKLSERQVASQRLELLAGLLPVGAWELEYLDGNPESPSTTLFVDEALRRLLGYSSSDDFPATVAFWRSIIHPTDVGHVQQAFLEHVLESGGTSAYAIRYRMRQKNGDYAWLIERCTTVTGSEGFPTASYGILVRLDGYTPTPAELARQPIPVSASTSTKAISRAVGKSVKPAQAIPKPAARKKNGTTKSL